MSATLKVHLADAPTDVLVHLVDNGPATISQLANVAPTDAIDRNATVSYAIDLLRRIGYVRGNGDTYVWAATESGIKAVRKARLDAAATEATS